MITKQGDAGHKIIRSEDTENILVATGLTPLYKVNATKIQYDLSDIAALNEVINDHETSNGVHTDYRYYFQFEAVIDPNELPTSCKVALLSCDFNQDAECKNVKTNDNSVGVAYRVDNNDKSCVVLGEISHFSSTLFDIKLPAKGISIRYEGGYNAEMNTNYNFHIDLECPNMAPEHIRNTNRMNNTVFEVTKYDDSTYSVHYITPLGCPSVCTHKVASELIVCNGRGLCALDPFDTQTKCLCDNGWEGDLCEYEAPPPIKHSDTIYIVVTCLLVLIIAAVTISGMSLYVKWKQRANIAWADLALFNNGDLANGLMRIRETSKDDDSDPDNFMCETYGYDDTTEETLH